MIGLFPACPDGWMNTTDSCYKVLLERNTYDDAIQKCQNLSSFSYLAVVNSAKENEFMSSLLDQTTLKHTWLGCTAMGGDYLWSCLDDSSRKTFNGTTGKADPEDSYWSESVSVYSVRHAYNFQQKE